VSADSEVKFHRIVMVASVIAVRGGIQREGEVVYLVAHRLVDLSAELASRSQPRRGFPAFAWTRRSSHKRERRPRSARAPAKGLRTRDFYVPDLHIDIIKHQEAKLPLKQESLRSPQPAQ
jgi:error-prone DNA polymerase